MAREREQIESTRWSARPVAAAVVRGAAVLVPMAASVAAVWLATRLVTPPTRSLGHYLGWWLALSIVATLALLAVGRVSRRLLPLAALLRLSLVFPDATPSRFRTAVASGTVRTLEERLADAKRRESTPAESARRLLALVAALDEHDGLTRGHSERVRAYSQMIGRELGLGRRELELLNWAALLHDIGKLEIAREILNKRGRPTEAEWDAIRSHPLLGETLVAPLRGWLGEWADAVADHHEHWSGGGYPRGLAGTEISLAGRIVAVADVFDVITSTRSYKQASTMAAARAEIARCAGTQFDPDVVRTFLAISLGRAGAAAGPASWLAHAAVLARTPLTSAGTLSAAAVVGVSVSPGGIAERGLLLDPSPAPQPVSAVVATGPRATAPPPISGTARGSTVSAPATAPAPGRTSKWEPEPKPVSARDTRVATPERAPDEPAAKTATSGSPLPPPTRPESSPPDDTPPPAPAPAPAGDPPPPKPGETAPPAPTKPIPSDTLAIPPELPEEPRLPEVPLESPNPDPEVVPDVPTLPDVPLLPEAPTPLETPTLPEVPSLPATPSLPPTPTLPSAPSPPETPTLPSAPSLPSTPSLPSAPSLPSTPQLP